MKKTLLSLILTAALILCALCICSCDASDTGDMAGSVFSDDSEMKYYNDCYFKIDGIDGEAKDSKHEKWINVLDFEMGSEYETETFESSFDPFVFVHKVDAATPGIQSDCMKGSHIKSGTLEVCRPIGGKQEVIYKATLEDLRIISAQISKDQAGNLIETVSITADKITWRVVPINIDNTIGGAVEDCYSVKNRQ